MHDFHAFANLLPPLSPQGGERDYYRKQAEHCKKRIELKRKTIAVYQEALREDQTALRWLQEDCASFIKRAEAHGQNKKITLPWDILTCIFSYLDEEDVFSFDGGDVRITGRPPVKPNWKDQLCHGKDCGLSFTSSTFPESKIKQYTTRLLETSSLTVHFNGLKLDHKQILGLLANFTDSRTIDSVVIYDSQSQQSWDRSSTSYREYCASFEKVLSRTRRLRFPGSCPSFLIKDQPESSKLNFRLAFSRLEHMSVSCRDFCLFHGYMQNLKSLDLHYKEFGDWSLKDNDNNLFCCLKSVSSLQRLRIQRVECDPYRRTTDYEMVFDCIADEQTVEFRPRNDPDELAITFPNLRELELHASDGFITGHIVRFLKCPVLEELKVYHRGNNERMSEYTYEDYHELMQTLSEAYPTIHRLALPKWVCVFPLSRAPFFTLVVSISGLSKKTPPFKFQSMLFFHTRIRTRNTASRAAIPLP